MQFRPALQYGQHASDGEVEHQIGFQIEMVRIQSEHGDHGQTPEFLQRRNEFRRAVRTCQQGQSVETLTLFGIAQQCGDVLAPFGVRIEIPPWHTWHWRVFDGVQNGGVGQFRQSGEMIVEGIAIHVGRTHNVGDGDFVILAFRKQLPECVLETIFCWQDFRIPTWSWHQSPPDN